MSILHIACANGRGPLFQHMVENGFCEYINNVNNNEGATAFSLAVKSYLVNDKFLKLCIHGIFIESHTDYRF